MKRYNLLNNVTGWSIFLIAAITYLSTIEPTASLWDCGEFIASGYKLEVGHPPGAPLFMMLGRFFSLFATSPDYVAMMINSFSALCSAFTILFLFWSITHLARKFVDTPVEQFSVSDYIMVLGSGAIGALAYTFSDTFWFSAVEGEVYAASSLITAVVFWAVLKWEEQADEPYADRWLILLAYVTGLSIGIHLLNLLAVPAIVFVYYFRKYPVTKGGLAKTFGLSILLLAALVWGIIPLVPKIGSWFELLFVNTFGLSINTGLLFYVVLLAAVLIYAVYYTKKQGKVLANALILGLSMIVLGYGSYAMIVIRSSANPPMDQNNPDNIFSLMSYLNRDQYGSRPLVTGPYYSATDGTTDLEYNYVKVGKFKKQADGQSVQVGYEYVKEDWKQNTKYDYTTIFPRMFGTDEDHKEVYKTYVTKGNTIRTRNGQTAVVPTFANNLYFFWDYQLNFMYWRYFLWNFVGRQNDMQAQKYDNTRGNWISGIKPIDELRLGTQDDLPDYLSHNKGRNTYFFLPLLLGLLGLVFQARRDAKNFTVVGLLFFFTGIAIVIYLNQTPNEPRERDYAYAGSFYAFSIWIGLGVTALWYLLKKYVPKQAAALAVLLALPIPLIMAQQNWDDHDRSGRYIAANFGYNYLSSCDENAIVYTYGDNDTFPLWYNQEVEGVRTDVRVANSMYLAADWYYVQMLRRAYKSAPLGSSATPEKVVGSRRNVVLNVERIKGPIPMKDALKFVMSDDEQTKVPTQFGNNFKMDFFPSKELRLAVDKEEMIRKGIVPAKDSAAIIPYFQINVPQMVYKNNLAVLDFLANNFPDRPIYYGISADRSAYMGIDNNLRQEGLAYRLVPEDVRISGPINVDKTFDLLVNKFRYQGLNDPKVYLDETARRMTSYYRTAFFSVARFLELQGDKERLQQLMSKFTEVLPEMMIPYYQQSNPIVGFYFSAGQSEKAIELSRQLMDEYTKELSYFQKMTGSRKGNYDYEVRLAYTGLSDLKDIVQRNGQADLQQEIEAVLKSLTGE